LLLPLPAASVGLPGLALAVAVDLGDEAVAVAVPPPLDGAAVDGVVVWGLATGASASAGVCFAMVLPIPSLVIFGAAPSMPAVQ
jgi:hypothetical protein